MERDLRCLSWQDSRDDPGPVFYNAQKPSCLKQPQIHCYRWRQDMFSLFSFNVRPLHGNCASQLFGELCIYIICSVSHANRMWIATYDLFKYALGKSRLIRRSKSHRAECCDIDIPCPEELWSPRAAGPSLITCSVGCGSNPSPSPLSVSLQSRSSSAVALEESHLSIQRVYCCVTCW